MRRRVSPPTVLSTDELFRLENLLADMVADLGEACPDPADREGYIIRLRVVLQDARQRLARGSGTDA